MPERGVVDTGHPASHHLRVEGRSPAPCEALHDGDSVNEESLHPSYRSVTPDGTLQVSTDTFKQNVLDLTRIIMTMQATGDYAAANAMAERLGVVRPPVQAMLDKVKDVPVNIEPRYVTAQQLEASTN
jgi:hypothetical protein